ncbi:MAG TPA: MFS transporter [Terriglobales bacterium]|nr:MFS transporter [Terriglobales bacterium]
MGEETASVLHHRKFLCLWSSQILSQVSVQTMNFVLLTRLFEMTGSSLSTSFLWLAYALPSVVFGPLAGAFVDARDRRELLMAANLVRGAAVFWLALSGQATPVFICCVVFLYSSLNQFYVPAEIASLPCLLPQACFPRATGLFFITQNVAVIVGFSVGGGLIRLLGVSRTLGLCGGLLVLAFVCVLLLPAMNVGPGPASSRRESDSLWGAVRHGFRFLRDQRDVFAPFLLLLSAQGALSMIIVTVPAVATELLRITARSAGLVVVVPFALGALAGVGAVPRLLVRGWRKKRVVEASLMDISLLVMALIAAVPGLHGWLRTASGSAIGFGMGLGFTGLVVPSQTMIQERTPERLQGRVFGNLSVLANITAIVPVMLSGTLASLLGVRIPLGLIGLLSLAGLVFSRRHGGQFLRSVSFKNPAPQDEAPLLSQETDEIGARS